jgi:RNA processing factor Prp31
MSDEKQELKLFYSLISGEIYTVEADEVDNLDQYQIPLLQRPKDNCKKCYGRMYIGRDVHKDIYIICHKCAKKCVDFDNMKDDEIVVETPKILDDIDFDAIAKDMK